ncbi:MAG: hypothetical protein Q9217_003010 [Psora testacea]
MPLDFNPPLINSASPWATTTEDLRALYKSPSTGAVTTRTCLLNGFNHDPSIHQHCFSASDDPSNTLTCSNHANQQSLAGEAAKSVISLNTYGYSPYPLRYYLDAIPDIIDRKPGGDAAPKAIIISVTGTPQEVAEAQEIISQCQRELEPTTTTTNSAESSIQTNQVGKRTTTPKTVRLLMEINLSCPNLANSPPPPAYSKPELLSYLTALNSDQHHYHHTSQPKIETGLKTPPYTHDPQFHNLISSLLEHSNMHPQQHNPITFITATNTLGSSLLLSKDLATGAGDGYRARLSNSTGTGIGGLAGSFIHPIALGNVATLRRMLDQHERLRQIEVIGVGGVSDRAGFERMRSVGAAAVGVATALGVEGVGVFGRILSGNKGDMRRLRGSGDEGGGEVGAFSRETVS